MICLDEMDTWVPSGKEVREYLKYYSKGLRAHVPELPTYYYCECRAVPDASLDPT